MTTSEIDCKSQSSSQIFGFSTGILTPRAAAENFALLDQQVDEYILKYDRLLALTPQSDSDRPSLLLLLVKLRNQRAVWSNQKRDWDKSITHLTESILLAFQPSSKDTVKMFYNLATSLYSRFSLYRQPEDIRSSLQYLRFLRINFHPLEAIGIRNGEELIPALVFALSQNLALG